MTPEHLHLALNHIPIIGLACAIAPLLLGVLRKQRLTIVAGLLIAAVSGWFTPFVTGTGEDAYERYEDGPIASLLDSDAEKYLEAHEHMAHDGSRIMYLTAILATVGLGLVFWRPKSSHWIGIIVIAACLISVAAGLWIADSGGKIRRPDFRSEIVVLTPADT